MQATDVAPTRFDAAKEAALRFVDEVDADVEVGLVSFAGTVRVEVEPTLDRSRVERRIEDLDLDFSTAIGDALETSTDLLLDLASDPDDEAGPQRDDDLAPGAIVLLSDGETTVGRPDSAAVDVAIQQDVPVSTIAFGTPQGTIAYDDPETPQVEQDLIPVPVREDNLRAIADATGGSFFAADSLEELDAVYEDIGSAIGYETELAEVSDWFVGGGLVLLLLSSALSLWWFQRLI